MNEVMQWYERDMTLAQAMDGIETNMWASVRNLSLIHISEPTRH